MAKQIGGVSLILAASWGNSHFEEKGVFLLENMLGRRRSKDALVCALRPGGTADGPGVNLSLRTFCGAGDSIPQPGDGVSDRGKLQQL